MSHKSIDLSHKEGGWTVFPNPVNNELKVALEGGLPDLPKIKIFDAKGSCLNLEAKQDGRFYVVDMGGLSAGIYFVHIQNKRTRVVKKVVKTNF